MAMYSFVPPIREAKFCGVPSCVFDKLERAAGGKSLRNTALDASFQGVLKVLWYAQQEFAHPWQTQKYILCNSQEFGVTGKELVNRKLHSADIPHNLHRTTSVAINLLVFKLSIIF
jgi:hypothetical protein